MKFLKTAMFFAYFAFVLQACSPLKSSSKDEKHQMELTLHEMRTGLDDLRHDLHCFQTEINILEGKIKHNETTLSYLKQSQNQSQIDPLMDRVKTLEKKLDDLEKISLNKTSDIKKLRSHADEVTSAFTQYKSRIYELEKEILSQNRKFDEIAKFKVTLEQMTNTLRDNYGVPTFKTYKVKAGDSLEKIAKTYNTNVEELKKINSLDQDLIVIGQELKVPEDNF